MYQNLAKILTFPQKRRRFLRFTCSALAAGCAGLIRPLAAFCADWSKSAFEARTWDGVLNVFKVSNPIASDDIVLQVPSIAVDGANVPVTVASKLPNTQMIAVGVENSAAPLAANFTFANDIEPEFTLHVKMPRTSHVKVLVHADGKYYLTSREVKVAAGACTG